MPDDTGPGQFIWRVGVVDSPGYAGPVLPTTPTKTLLLQSTPNTHPVCNYSCPQFYELGT